MRGRGDEGLEEGSSPYSHRSQSRLALGGLGEKLGVPVLGIWTGRCGLPFPSDLVLSLGLNPRQFYGKSVACLLKPRRR